MKLLSLGMWCMATIFATSSIPRVASQECGPRVRRNWDALSADDKATYRGAIAAAMQSGAHIKFVELHMEMRSEMEAHGQCMFTYWHRLMLLAYENMLRAQGAAYACVTIPYWDWITGHTRYTAGQCQTMAECSSILNELGGVPPNTPQRTVEINGASVQGFCVGASPLENFCESSITQTCAQCVPRSDWNRAVFPAAASYASVMNQVFSARSIGEMSPNLEQGSHNSVHGNLESTMTSFAAPADPLFYSHHAMVDLLHVVFHKCRVGTTRLTFQEKITHPVAWSSCRRRDGAPFNPTDVITMRTGAMGRNTIPASEDSVIGQYFNGLPNQYASLMDIRDLGASSYSYELSGVTATMWTNCGTNGPAPPVPAPVRPGPVPVRPVPVPVRPVPAPVVPRSVPMPIPAPAPIMGPMGPRPQFPVPGQIVQRPLFPVPIRAPFPIVRPWWLGGRGLRDEVAIVDKDTFEQVNVVDEKCANKSKRPLEAVIVKYKPMEPAVASITNWYANMTSQISGTPLQALAEVERMACVYQEECLGGIQEYSDQFKKVVGQCAPRCKKILAEYRAGKTTICVNAWRSTMEKQFGCPRPISVYPVPGPTPVVSTSAPAPTPAKSVYPAPVPGPTPGVSTSAPAPTPAKSVYPVPVPVSTTAPAPTPAKSVYPVPVPVSTTAPAPTPAKSVYPAVAAK